MYQDDEKDPVNELVHLYVDGAFDRRELWSRVTKLFGSGAAATAALGGYSEVLAQTPSFVVVELRRKNVCTCLGHHHPRGTESRLTHRLHGLSGVRTGELDRKSTRLNSSH